MENFLGDWIPGISQICPRPPLGINWNSRYIVLNLIATSISKKLGEAFVYFFFVMQIGWDILRLISRSRTIVPLKVKVEDLKILENPILETLIYPATQDIYAWSETQAGAKYSQLLILIFYPKI